MPTENETMVREAYEALSRSEFDGLAGLLDPEVEFRNPDYAMEAGVRHGHEGFRKAMEAAQDVIEEPRWDIERIVEAGDVIVVVGRFTGRGRTGGVPVESPFGHVLELRAGKVVSVSWFQDAAEAFAAAGLSPPR